ncbi:MAG: hypothetical protein P9L98_00460 [Candidatus Kaelpia imicola]|nr:hypothetical protein [Candidatus Kaelpia imicola]
MRKRNAIIAVFLAVLLINSTAQSRRVKEPIHSIFLSEKQGKVILTDETLQNIINRYYPEITVEQIKATIETPDCPVEVVNLNYPQHYIYIKHIGDKRIRVKVNHLGEVFWADSEQLIIH